MRWMRGECFEMSVVLAERLKLPVWGLFDATGNCHHAFVWDAELEMGVDGRGVLPLELLRAGCAGQQAMPLGLDALRACLGRPNASHGDLVDMATRRAARQHIQQHIEGRLGEPLKDRLQKLREAQDESGPAGMAP